jgi:hypothetical protein
MKDKKAKEEKEQLAWEREKQKSEKEAKRRASMSLDDIVTIVTKENENKSRNESEKEKTGKKTNRRLSKSLGNIVTIVTEQNEEIQPKDESKNANAKEVERTDQSLGGIVTIVTKQKYESENQESAKAKNAEVRTKSLDDVVKILSSNENEICNGAQKDETVESDIAVVPHANRPMDGRDTAAPGNSTPDVTPARIGRKKHVTFKTTVASIATGRHPKAKMKKKARSYSPNFTKESHC